MSKFREPVEPAQNTADYQKGDRSKQADDNERFRNTMRQAPVGIAILRGEDFIVEMANDSYLHVVDRREEDFVGRSLFDSLPEVRLFVEPILLGVLRSGIPFHGSEFEVIIHRTGKPEVCYFNFVYQPLQEEEGETAGVIVVATEVTQQVLSKQALQRSESKFRNMVTQSQFAKAIFQGPDFVISIANETMLKNLWRRELREVEGKKLFDVFPELIGQKFSKILENVYHNGVVHRENEALAYVDGPGGMMEYYLDYQYAPIFEMDGTVMAIVVSVNDVTEKVKFRQQIAEAADRLTLATDGTRLATWDLNLQTFDIIHSGRLASIFGFDESNILTHQQMRALVHPDDRILIVEPAFKIALETGVYYYEARIVHLDKSVHWVRTQGKVLYGEGHIPARMLGTMMDITDRKEAELALKTSEEKFRTLADSLETQVQLRTTELTIANNELIRTNMELAQFAYVASHDLQEPLRKIQTFATRILETEEGNLSEKGKDYFSRMQASSTRMQQLIVDLLAFSRANVVEKHFEETDLNVVLKNVKEQLSDLITQKNAVIKSEHLPVRSVIVYQFEQLFMNLIANALKFVKPGIAPIIKIRTGKISGDLISLIEADPNLTYEFISFSDNGIGFEPQFKERIFQVFQRLHNRSTYEGTGIGLAICKKITDNHKGLIDAVGKPGIGATFIIYLPIGVKLK